MESSRPDVACFLPALEGGGAERVLLDLGAAFTAFGKRVDLVVAAREGALAESVPDGVRTIDLACGRTSRALLPLARYLRRTRPRSLIATLTHANLVALLASRAAPGLRVVLREANVASLDTDHKSTRSRALAVAARWTYAWADSVIAVSEGVASDLEQHLRVPRHKIVTIANPALTDRLFALAREPLDDPWLAQEGAPPVIVAIGRLAPQKGFDTLVRAFALVRRRRPCRLVVLGEGDQRAELERLARDHGIADDVRLPGFVTNPFPYLARAGAFALSSRWEGLPNALIQAVALGTPAVATDCVSGPSEVLDDPELGLLVPVDDPVAMADALALALERPRRVPPETWLARYRVDTVARAYLDVLLPSPGGT